MENNNDPIAIIISTENNPLQLYNFYDKLNEYNIKLKNSSKGIVLSNSSGNFSINFTTHSVTELKKSYYIFNHLLERIEDNSFELYVSNKNEFIRNYSALNCSKDNFEEYCYMLTTEAKFELSEFFEAYKDVLTAVAKYENIRIIYKKNKVNISIIKNIENMINFENWKINLRTMCDFFGVEASFHRVYKFKR